jgi:uncharacterized protein YdhG (YjbR/CyaY superfamily)
MISKTTAFENVDDYIAGFPKTTQLLLKQVRAAIKKAAPKAEEVISYNMPAFKYFGVLVYFAGYERHIGFYPTASGIANFKQEISRLKSAKGSVQFPIDKPMPLSLIAKIVKFKVKENETKSALKRKVKK